MWETQYLRRGRFRYLKDRRFIWCWKKGNKLQVEEDSQEIEKKIKSTLREFIIELLVLSKWGSEDNKLKIDDLEEKQPFTKKLFKMESMDSLLPCDESKKSIFEIDTLYRCNSLDKNTTFPPKQRSKSPSRQSEKRREDQPHVRFAKEPSLEFHIPECSEESEDRESPLPILCSTLHPKPILKKTTPRKTHACTIIVYGEWGFVSLT